MKNTAKTVCEQLKLIGIPYKSSFSYRDLADCILIGRRGLISLNEKEDSREFEYWHIYIPKVYVKKIERIMKNLGIEKYLCPSDVNNSP